MSAHRYILEPYKGIKSRYRCPSCQGVNKTFSLYIDKRTGEHIHPSVGRCDRESNCGHHYTPKQYFQDNYISFDTSQPKVSKLQPVVPQHKPASLITIEIFKRSLQIESDITEVAKTNYFVKFLIGLFGTNVANQLVGNYFIATSKHWNGATIFWQIDTHGKVRTGKIMLYNPVTGRRVKAPFNHINWVHKTLKQAEFELRQCLFGEHLLIDKTKTVAIVESEKTAVIASAYLPQFIWVAVGSLTNLNIEKCRILEGRSVVLFPDLNGFDKWQCKAKELSTIAKITVCDLLERKATDAEKKQGLDLADYLVRFDYGQFVVANSELPKNALLPSVQQLYKADQIEQTKGSHHVYERESVKAESWEMEINKLEECFSKIIPPTQSLKLNESSTIINVSQFIESHFATLKANNGNKTFLPFLKRLQLLSIQLLQN